MQARTRTTRQRTVLTITNTPAEKRPPPLSTPRVDRLREKRLARGCCRECGRPRLPDRKRGKTYPYRQRCIRCQARERARGRRLYAPNFETIQKRGENPVNRFVHLLEKWDKNGTDPVRRIKQRRRR